jgi:ATP-dependent phosphofructokinase / diphosphate-dependent phosphofructokinase
MAFRHDHAQMNEQIRRIGVFVAGGPAPGINGVLKAIVEQAENHGIAVTGFLDGGDGLARNRTCPLNRDRVENINILGGAILGTSRFDPRRGDDTFARIDATLDSNRIDGLISIGGEGTAQFANALRLRGRRVVHVPKTIDNDIAGIPQTFGFDTAVHEACRLLSSVKLDAESSEIWFVIEIMGRYTGHLAVEAGLAASVTRVLIPEEGPIDVPHVVELVESRLALDLNWGVVLVAESANFGEGFVTSPDGRLGGIAELLARKLQAATLERKLPTKVRASSLGYFLRCAEPTGFDRAYAAELGMGAVDLLLDPGSAGAMVVIADDQVAPVPLERIAGQVKLVDLNGIRYRTLKASERYESCRTGVLRRGAPLLPVGTPG